MSAVDSDIDYDIAIIGGGMVGSTLAALLSATGAHWRIALLDSQAIAPDASAHFRSEYDNRSTALSSGSADLLQRLNLWPRLSQHATAIRQVHVSDQGHLGGAQINAQEQQRPALGYVLENAWLAPCLREAAQSAPGVTSLVPAQVKTLVPGESFTTLILEGEAASSLNPRSEVPSRLEVTTRLAILADGGASPLRQQLGIGLDTTDYQQSAIIANVTYERPHEGCAFERFTPDGPMALLPLDESPRSRRSALVWTLPPERAQVMMAATEAERLAALQKTFGWRLGRFQRMGECQCWPLQLVQAKEQVRSRLALVGNTAHYLHPVAGQGFNLSLRDAASLAATLRRAHEQGRDPGELQVLQRYREQREHDQALTINLSDRLVRIFSNRRLPLMALRHLGFLGLDWLPGVKDLFAAQTMGIATARAPWEPPESALGVAGAGRSDTGNSNGSTYTHSETVQ